MVDIDCKPGPPTIFTSEEEDLLVKYIVNMADMGFGLSTDDIMALAFSIAERTHKEHVFKNGVAGRGWFNGFRSHHPRLVLRTPQTLSYCRALNSNKFVIDDFFAKLGGVYRQLNLISKPMLIYNADETGVGIVTKPGKVFAEIVRRNVYTITAAERGKTHTIMSCVSASGSTLPPLMIYPRKRSVPDKMRAGAVGGTLFEVSDNGWINKEIFLVWLQHFVDSIPPVQPVLLILDGHSSHVTIEAIELARSNDVHMLCLPSHTTHILQPLDVGVFKPFKAAFSKASHQFIMQNPGRVITNDVLASLVGDAWPHAFTPLNIMAGFKKCGIHHFNPGEILDRLVAPSKAVTPPPPILNSPEVSVFSPEKQSLFQKRYEEGYDLNDPEYMVWLRINHSDEVNSASSSVSSASATLSHQSKQSNESSSHQSKQSNESLSTSHQSKQSNESLSTSHQRSSQMNLYPLLINRSSQMNLYPLLINRSSQMNLYPLLVSQSNQMNPYPLLINRSSQMNLYLLLVSQSNQMNPYLLH